MCSVVRDDPIHYTKLSLDFLPRWSRFWKFGANHLKTRLQVNHVPVHETHSATVREIPMASETPSLTDPHGIGCGV
jgi:hypothetical protein